MDWNSLQQVIAQTNAQYSSGNDQQKQAAVAARDAAVRQYESYRDSLPRSSPSPQSTSSTPAPPPVPPLPSFTRMTAPDKNIKPAPSDIIQFDESSVDIALIQDLLFEDIGAVELANISRTDLIDGQEVMYSPIKNLSSVRREFNPNNIIATSYATDFFSRFGIDLISRGIYEPYFDEDGNLIVEIETVGDGEEIQVQVLSSGTISVIEEL
jgi:hypothetical protein